MIVFVKCAERTLQVQAATLLLLLWPPLSSSVWCLWSDSGTRWETRQGEAEFGGMCFCGSQSLLCQKFLLAAQSRWASRTSPMWWSLLLRSEHRARVLLQYLPCIFPSPGNRWRVEEKDHFKAWSLETVRGHFLFSLVSWIFSWRIVFSAMPD